MTSEPSWGTHSRDWSRTRPPPIPSPEERLDAAERELYQFRQWAAQAHQEILRLQGRLHSLERARRILWKVWRLFWSDPVKYALAILGIIAWLTGKVTWDQLMHSYGNAPPPG